LIGPGWKEQPEHITAVALSVVPKNSGTVSLGRDGFMPEPEVREEPGSSFRLVRLVELGDMRTIKPGQSSDANPDAACSDEILGRAESDFLAGFYLDGFASGRVPPHTRRPVAHLQGWTPE
jgi:hypothetical protein